MATIDSENINCVPPGKDNTPVKPKKRGPKPKQLVETVKLGFQVGRNKVVVPPDEVQKLAALGCKNHEICDYFGITTDSLSRNFAPELVKGREDMKISLRRAMLNNAVLNNNAALQIFLSKNFLGLSDNGPTDSDENKPLPWSD